MQPIYRTACRRATIRLSRKCISAQFSKRRCFHASRSSRVIQPFLLADIGEGITECQLVQWFVQPGARVEQFDKICEVQSDKASVEITSPFDGVVKKLHYEPDDMAVTGKPLIDIDVQEEVEEEEAVKVDTQTVEEQEAAQVKTTQQSLDTTRNTTSKSHLRGLATPAVRHLMKQLDVRIEDMQGTGRDGRVLKEDVQKWAQQRTHTASNAPMVQHDRGVALTAVQTAMFKTMTRSLSIPHFLYSCSTDMTEVTSLRQRLNAPRNDKITPLAVIIKAVSLAFKQHEILNATLDTSTPDKPALVYHSTHNFGIAVDTPSGLLVPVLKDVQNLSISHIATQIRDISARAREHKLSPADFKGATFTISNIGSIGGGVVSPVITEPQVAILGIGRSRIVPAFDADGELCRREELVMSWSADHRVVDGAECARCAEKVKSLLENPASMMAQMV